MIMQESAQKWLSEKAGFQKAVKIPVFCHLLPQIRLVSFSVDNYTQKHPNGSKRLKLQKRQFTNFNISFKVL